MQREDFPWDFISSVSILGSVQCLGLVKQTYHDTIVAGLIKAHSKNNHLLAGRQGFCQVLGILYLWIWVYAKPSSSRNQLQMAQVHELGIDFSDHRGALEDAVGGVLIRLEQKMHLSELEKTRCMLPVRRLAFHTGIFSPTSWKWVHTWEAEPPLTWLKGARLRPAELKLLRFVRTINLPAQITHVNKMPGPCLAETIPLNF